MSREIGKVLLPTLIQTYSPKTRGLGADAHHVIDKIPNIERVLGSSIQPPKRNTIRAVAIHSVALHLEHKDKPPPVKTALRGNSGSSYTRDGP